jgi:hypothetical protein
VTRPAIAFETAPSASPDVLPRMDVAAFVGIAESGPLDVPVPIEDLARYRDIFGADPEVAFDAELQAPHRGYLGAAVEAFFANGGRRCWVVRVAQRPGLATFAVPGLAALYSATGTLATGLPLLQARSPGTWAAGLYVHATLQEAALPQGTGGGARLELAAPDELVLLAARAPGFVTPGDLLRVRSTSSERQLFIVAARVEEAQRALRTTSRDWRLARASVGDDPTRPSPRLAPLDPAELDLPSGELSSTDVEVHRLTFSLSLWRGHERLGRIDSLAFSPQHPRFWGNLPSDEDLFWRGPAPRGDGRELEVAALWEEASGARRAAASSVGRFAVAASQPDPRNPPVLFLPSGMPTAAKPVGGDVPERDDGALRSGVELLTPDMFVDERLRDYGGDSLLRSAEAIQSAARDADRSRRPRAAARGAPPERLRGIHALLNVEEATLIAVPDAVHRGWSTNARSIGNLLPAPELLDARPDGERVCARWSRVAEATGYRLQTAARPDFEPADSTHTLDEPEACVVRDDACAATIYVRVQALRDGEPSAWSNTRRVSMHGGGFLECVTLDVGVSLSLAAEPGDAPRVLHWKPVDGAVPSTVLFELQSSADVLFRTDVRSSTTWQSEFSLPAVGEAVRYYRVRARSLDGALAGPWSNTVAFSPPSLARPVLDPAASAGGRVRFDDSLLVAVHRGLLRFAHARGDLLALLALPRHYGALDVEDYLAAISPDATAPFVRTAAAGASGRPLTPGESAVLSYGALYYPWVAQRIEVRRGAAEPRFIPCDGVAAGHLARIALERGAWIAAANRALRDVLAVTPRLAPADADELLAAQVNVVERAAQGFVFLEDQTLGRDTDTRAVSVRRLLILIKRLALREGAALVFEPNDDDLRERLATDFERVLSTLYQRGALQGAAADEAFAVVVDETVNTAQSMDAGRLIVELRVAPSQPLKFLRVRLVQNGPQGLATVES